MWKMIFFVILLKMIFNNKEGKMKKWLAMLFIMLAVNLVGPQTLYADRRSYVWTYEYMTMPKGMFEVEYYLTQQQPNIDKARPNTWKHYIELEYGITDRWDIAMYQRLKHSNTESDSSFEYDGFKIRARYRIAEKNELPIDMLLYLEYIRDDDFKKPNVLEGKIIFAKDIANFNISYNQILKQELESGGKTKHEYAAGITYAVYPQVKIGVETKGNYSDEKYYIGPTIAWATNKFWTTLGIVAGLNNRSDDLQARLIIGIPF
jgi:hypothetical protein